MKKEDKIKCEGKREENKRRNMRREMGDMRRRREY